MLGIVGGEGVGCVMVVIDEEEGIMELSYGIWLSWRLNTCYLRSDGVYTGLGFKMGYLDISDYGRPVPDDFISSSFEIRTV